MPKIGVSRPYVAEYAMEGETPVYKNGDILARGVEISAAVESATDNDFYADNGLAESDTSFANGTVTLTVDDLTEDKLEMIFGLRRSIIVVDGESVSEVIYDNQAVAPHLGFGIVIKRRRNNKDQYRALILTKIKLSYPEDAATTQGETIDWQTTPVDGIIFRDDSPTQMWKREAVFTTEIMARKYIEKVLNITLKSLMLTATAGTAEGTTAIKVNEELGGGNRRYYTVDTELTLPEFNSYIGSSYTLWGGADIPATDGDQVMIVEVDSDGYVRKAAIIDAILA